MSDISIKLGATITFDKEKESDIVTNLHDLLSRRKLGAYLNRLIRYVWENPDKFKDTEIEMEKWGLTYTRQEFFKEINDEINSIKSKIKQVTDELHSIQTVVKTYDILGVYEKIDMSSLAMIAIDKHIKKFETSLGYNYPLYNIDKEVELKNIGRIVDQAVEVILEMLGGKDEVIKENISIRDIHNNSIKNEISIHDILSSRGNTIRDLKDEGLDEEMYGDSEVEGYDMTDDDTLRMIEAFCGVEKEG